MGEYEIYRKSLGDIPEFLNKYLNLDIMVRLHDISLLCGMDYASKYAYDFPEYISRFDHSLDCALITWKLTHDKTQTLAALFHDISTPIFSHVIDYLNKDFVSQESTEEMTGEVLCSSWKLKKYLQEDGVNLEDIINFKKFSVVDLERPYLCVDRVDGTLCSAINWTQNISGEECADIVSNLMLVDNENGVKEIAFGKEEDAILFTRLNDSVNKATHTNNDNYMMNLLSEIVELTISLGLIDYESLFYITEKEYIEIIEDNLDMSNELSVKWELFKTIDNIPYREMPKIKNKIINPLVVDKRLK